MASSHEQLALSNAEHVNRIKRIIEDPSVMDRDRSGELRAWLSYLLGGAATAAPRVLSPARLRRLEGLERVCGTPAPAGPRKRAQSACRASWRRRCAEGIPTPPKGRPAWMSDPGALPRSPPGRSRGTV